MEFDDKRAIAFGSGGLLGALLLAISGLGWYWSIEPELPAVESIAQLAAAENGEKVVVGYTTVSTLIHLADTLLEKPGGYISNDVLPPGIVMDNMPNWEFGVLVQIRDMTRDLRKEFARSQSTSVEDPDLARAEPQFNFDSESHWFPSSEGEYRQGIAYLERYRARLSDENNPQAQFFARADNLRNWLGDVQTRLGSMSQKLSASVAHETHNVDLAGDAEARSSTAAPAQMRVQTPWMQIDDVFYEARGSAWATILLLRAIEVDFRDVLEKKNAAVSLRQIIRELEQTQQPVFPVLLNGSGFGMFANHSLVMANYVSRANAALIDLRELLARG
jgi:hypothetical protein